MVNAAFHYIDVVLVLLTGPVLLLLGATAAGYGVGAATWIIVRAFGIAVDRNAGARVHVAQQLALRVGYRFARVFLLTFAAVLALKAGGKADGLTSLLVVTAAFTIQLSFSILGRAVAAADASARAAVGADARAAADASARAAVDADARAAVGDAEQPGMTRSFEP